MGGAVAGGAIAAEMLAKVAAIKKALGLPPDVEGALHIVSAANAVMGMASVVRR